MRIVTDSTPLEEPKDPTNCNVVALYRLFATADEVAALEANYREPGFGYGDAKKLLFERMWETFEPYRERRAELEANMDYVEDVLRKSAEKARELAGQTLAAARRAVGLI
jgi:tryptophanyl-tRNA synthetase